jgi:hypothetical protein
MQDHTPSLQTTYCVVFYIAVKCNIHEKVAAKLLSILYIFFGTTTNLQHKKFVACLYSFFGANDK